MNKIAPGGNLAMLPATFPVSGRLDGGAADKDSVRPLIAEALSILRRRKWLIAGGVAAALLIGLLVTLLMTPQYTVTATLEIQRENSGPFNVNEKDTRSTMVDQEFYETQYGLLRARSLAERVATDLRLYDDARFLAMFDADEDWFENAQVAPNKSTREQRIRAAATVLLDNLSIEHERLSRLVDIEFTSPDPQLSRRIVDAWTGTFIRQTLDRRFEASSYARQFLESRLAQLRSRIDSSERQLVDYASRQGIVNLPAATAGPNGAIAPERSLAADDLAALNQELARARAERIRAESRLGTPAAQATEALENPAINELRQQRARLGGDYARLMVQFEPGYPPARALQSQIDQLDRALAREERRVGGSVQEGFQAAVQREQALASRVEQLKGQVLDLRRRSIQYNIIERDADTNRQLYDALLQRYKEIGIAGGVGVNNISIVDRPQVPLLPSSPKLLLNLLVALGTGLALGIGAAWAFEQLDMGIADPREVEDELHVPLLGTVPKVVSQKPLELLADRKSAASEAYVSIQTALSFATDHGIPAIIAVTSSKPAEGKSTTAFALAVSLARSNRRVILVDGDLRSPSVHHNLEIKNVAGLSNLLSGENDVGKLVRQSGVDNLDVLTAGPQPPSAPELLGSERFNHVLAELGKIYQHVVVDAPPVMGLADALLIGSQVESVVYVIEAHSTQKNMARVALARLANANAPIVGAVLTKFDSKRAHYGYGYDYGYGYSYGGNKAA
ncbi:MAG TPA: polysaccharide biosynthesis tyrosine autokinase [Sphingomicrobium sp.]|jgi:capsular exopolysaccharide synthesis family protein